MRWLAWLAALLLAGCGGERQAYVTVLDPGYRAELIGSDGFTAPDGLLWHEGRLIMADEGGSAIRAWRPGGLVETLADENDGLASPEDLVRDRAGNLYFSDDDAGGVRRIDTQGQLSWLAAPDRGLRSTEAIALAPSGAVLVGDQRGRRIVAIGLDGGMSVLVGPQAGIAKPESLAFDDDGNLYIGDNRDDILYLLTRDGRLQRPIAGRRGFSPESLLFAGGALFITDSRHGTLFRFRPEDGLQAVAIFSGDLANLQGVTADEAGNLYLSVQADLDGGRGYVLRLTRRR